MTFIKKGGWGQNLMKTDFFFAISTLFGIGGRTLYHTISLPISSIEYHMAVLVVSVSNPIFKKVYQILITL